MYYLKNVLFVVAIPARAMLKKQPEGGSGGEGSQAYCAAGENFEKYHHSYLKNVIFVVAFLRARCLKSNQRAVWGVKPLPREFFFEFLTLKDAFLRLLKEF